ncbi:MAG: amidohydrolase family protein [Burkholderiales bacterium]|nr:amidohydrolase family protein [Burkholderiales bacterium]
MFCNCTWHRRDFLKLAGGASTLAALGAPAALAQGASGKGRGRAAGGLPARGEYLIRAGHVLTMDPVLGDLPAGDVHVRNGTIVAVGPRLAAPGARVVDARDRIVMPGFIDTHWHLWCTALRLAIRADDPQEGYFPTTIRVGRHCTPQDAYAGVRLGVVEGLLSGITTVHDWSHNTVTPEHADAEIQALKDMGVRARFSYGAGQGHAADRPMNFADLARVKQQWMSSDGMLGIGACLRTPGPGGTRGAISVELFRSEFEGIRKLGLPMTIHCGPKNLIDLMGRNELLGPDMLLVHPQGMTPGELKMVGDTKSPYSIAPVIEMSYSAVRNGTIQYSELNALGVPLGLSVDASAATNADFFNVMRARMWSEWQRTGAPLRLKPRRLVELATLEGARLLGIADKVGSLSAGKRADLILVRTADINMAPMGDPYYALAFQGQPANVDTVMVDGRVLVRGGRLAHADVARVVKEAGESARGILARAARG